MDKLPVPRELDHLKMIVAMNQNNRAKSNKHLKSHESDLRLLGTSLSALYEAATCHRKCYGGDHVFEGIAARTYNLACSAYSLISIGYYDEALNLIRSIGEISNLVALYVKDKELWKEWVNADKKTRFKKFTPVKVRKLLGDDTRTLMDEDWYSELCESYAHIAPDTNPNMHNELQRRVTGGLVQEQGIKKSIRQLTFLISMVSLVFCKISDMDDLFDPISAMVTDRGLWGNNS